MGAVPPQLQVQLATEAELAARLATGGCKLIEVFSEWSGPCKSILPTCKKLRLDGKDEEQLAFLLIAAESCTQHEALKEHVGKSEPLFLVYRNGQLKSRVHGANIPLLLEALGEYVTPLPGLDDLEENPFYIASKAGGSDGGAAAAGKDAKRDSRIGAKKK